MTAPIRSMPEPHVFEIDRAVWEALKAEDVVDTVEAMHELGIYSLPYDGEIILRLRFDKSAQEIWTEVRGLREGDDFSEQIVIYPDVAPRNLWKYKHWVATDPDAGLKIENVEVLDLGVKIEGKRVVHRFEPHFPSADPQKYYRDALIVLLASKGLAKSTRKSGLAKLGIGKKGNEYVTTLRLAQNLESHESVRSGQPVRPHLRRGHIRSQHYGAQNSLVKRIWIEPCFVNADENFLSARKAYRVLH